MITEIYLNNDNTFRLRNVKNNLTGAFINDATPQFTLYDRTGTEVAGIVWPLTMTPTGIDGEYVVTADKAAALTENEPYRGEIVLNSSGLDGQWEPNYIARRRT